MISSTPFTNSAVHANTSCSQEDDALRLPLALLYSLIFLLGLAGNLLALWVFLFLQTGVNSIRVFLINVALADLVLVACLPFRVLYHFQGNVWTLGELACRAVGNLFYMNMYVSITLLGLISMERYLKVGRGWRRSMAQRWTRGNRWSYISCTVLWIVSLALVLPMIALEEGNETSGKCFQYKQRRTAQGRAYFNLLMVALFWTVFVGVVASYAQIARRLLQASRSRPDFPNASRYAGSARRAFVVPVLFALCFGPYHTFRGIYVLSQLHDTTCETRRLMDHTNEAMLLFAALNSALDPLMYFLLSGSMRRAVAQALMWMRIERGTFESSTTELRRTSLSLVSTAAALATSRGSVENSVSFTKRCANPPGSSERNWCGLRDLSVRAEI
ncbi:hypothetical protein DNTS_003496 [Danionella cerebrum]|uniref:Probable G-protein coupled receptor 34 n=1 Tax=Danionella cerebrum TaxID=2873325 RepID=A0A553MLE8_9TELE|nr:hypothetical protein DNTS_003496 [Danionella translucida]